MNISVQFDCNAVDVGGDWRIVWNLYADFAPGLYGSNPAPVGTTVSYKLLFDTLGGENDVPIEITISSGNSSGSNFYSTFEGDSASNVVKNPGFSSPSPASFGTQVYLDGGIDDLCI